MAGKAMRCRESFACEINGVPIVVPEGTLVYASDNRYKGREHLFEEVDKAVERFSPRTERATAEPDEKRTLAGHRVHPPREENDRASRYAREQEQDPKEDDKEQGQDASAGVKKDEPARRELPKGDSKDGPAKS